MTGENDNDNTNPIASDSVQSTKEETKVPTDSQQNTSSPPKKTKPPKKRSGVLLWLLLFVIVIGGIVVAGYFGWQFWQQQQTRLQTLETEATRQHKAIQQLENAQATLNNGQQERLQQLQQQQQLAQERLDSYAQRLRTLAGTSRDDWLLAEARYLLRLASQRLLIDSESNSALSLLETADTIIAQIDDPAILPVRQTIATDITRLKLAPKIDKEGLYVKIGALKQQVQSLPLIPQMTIKETEAPAQNDATPVTTEKTWYQPVWNSIQQAFGSLGRFVQIRHHEQTPDLLLSEKEQLQIVNRLLLTFEQTQYTLLREQQTIYRNSLQEALNSWDVYYSHYPEYQPIRDELQTLQNLNIINEQPDISASARALTDYIERFHKLSNDKTSTAETTQ